MLANDTCWNNLGILGILDRHTFWRVMVKQHSETHYNTSLKHTARHTHLVTTSTAALVSTAASTHRNTLQHIGTHCNTYTPENHLHCRFGICFRSNTLQPTTTHCNVLQHTTRHTHLVTTSTAALVCATAGAADALPTPTIAPAHTHVIRHCTTLHHTATHCNTLQHAANALPTPTIVGTAEIAHTHGTVMRHCDTLQQTATHCNTLQHTATHRQCLAPPPP